LIKGPLSLVLLGGIAWLTQSVAWSMIAVGVSWLLILLSYDLPNSWRGEREFEAPARLPGEWLTKRQLRLITLGLPLAVSLMLLTLTNSMPNILIERYLGEHDVGIYAALTSLAWAGVPLINAMGQTAMPKFGQYFVAGDYARLRMCGLSLSVAGGVLGLAGVAASWLCGDFIVLCCYGHEFTGQADVLTWVMLAATLLFFARFLGDALTAMRCVRSLLLTQTASALVVLVGSIATLPGGGLVGLAQVLTAALALRAAVFLLCFLVQTREKPLPASCLAADSPEQYGSPTAGLEMAA
jgi:O-antigen/teichoic acid export membrane protein